MQGRDVPQRGRELLAGRGFCVFVLLEVRLHLAQHVLLLGEGRRILGTLLCRVLHCSHIVRLCVLLLRFGLRHLLVEVLDQEVHHRHHAQVLLGLLGVRAEGLGRRGRGIPRLLVRRDLRKDGPGHAHVCHDAVICRQLLLRWRLVQLGVVELVQPVLCEPEEFFSCCVGRHQLFVLLVFFFPLLGCLGNRLIQLLDSRL
mmetsp:Transcript_92484/g.299227  ORF Transcript_92484/g.299227 Transcript_92484/m.299227 type:complete len:200 (-) Transcript_92484:1461-2060(-)